MKNKHKITQNNNIIFKRIDPEEIKTKINTQNQSSENVVITNKITIEDFAKVELKVGEILEAEKVQKSEKLLKFSVDVGEKDPRCIVSGIAKHYNPQDLIGKKVCVVTNLKPAKGCGRESCGMLPCACAEDKIVLISPYTDVPVGSTIS